MSRKDTDDYSFVSNYLTYLADKAMYGFLYIASFIISLSKKKCEIRRCYSLIYFTSDTHFGHHNIIRLCNRPFTDTDEMNEYMINKWNEKVNGNDTVYIIGDLFFRCKNPKNILSQLKGKKHLIIGNHDNSWLRLVDDASGHFKSVSNYLEISDGMRGITLCHYPMMSWKHKQKTYMIHGHIHNDTSLGYWQYLKENDRILNAGVDINGFSPVSFEELLNNNIRFKNNN